MQQIFISYQHIDRLVAERVRTRLQTWDYDVWMDVHDIPKGAYWPDEIDKGLVACDVVIGLMSPEALASRSVKNEWHWAIDNNKPLIPLLLRPCDTLPHRFNAITYIDFQNEEEGFSDLRGALKAPWSQYREDESQLAAIPRRASRLTDDSNRHVMLEKVQQFWVTNVLEPTLQYGSMNVGISPKPEALLRHREYGDYRLPSDAKITDIFVDMQRELLILGAPGAGKTTLMLMLLRDLIVAARKDYTEPVPVVFNLSSWAVGHQLLNSWLVGKLRRQYQVPKKVGTRWLENGTLTVLLDGLDEVVSEYRDACVTAINNFRREYSFVDTVVCSRLEEYESLTTKLDLQGAVILEPLSQVQIDKYVQGEDSAVLRSLVKSDVVVQEMARSPFLLNALMITYRGMKSSDASASLAFADRRDDLFERYIKRIFNRDRRYTLRQTRHYLSCQGKYLCDHRRTIFYIEDLQPDVLGGFREKAIYGIARMLAALICGAILVTVSRTALHVLRKIPQNANERALDAARERDKAEEHGVASWVTELVAGWAEPSDPVERFIEDFAEFLSMDANTLRVKLKEVKARAARQAMEEATQVLESVRDYIEGEIASGNWDSGIKETEREFIPSFLQNARPAIQAVCWYFEDSEAGQLMVLPYLEGVSLRIDLENVIPEFEDTELEQALTQELIAEALESLTAQSMRDLQHATRRAEKTKTEAERAKALVGFTQSLILGLGLILLPFVLARLLRSGIVCVEVVRLAWGGALAGACLSALMVVVVFIAFGSAVVLEKPLVSLIGLSFVLGSVLFGALWYGTRRARNTVDKRVAPNHGIRQSARNAIRLGLLFGVFVLTPNALLFAFVSHTFGTEKTLISVVGWSLVTAINSALVFGGAAVVKHLLLRMILWGVGDAPWNYPRFLDSCGEMGVLRNVGGGYIFVHRYLLEYFAGLNE